MTFLIPDFFHEVTDHLVDSGSIPLPPFESDDTLPPAHHVLQQRMSSGSLSLESISSSGKSTSSPGVRNSREEIRPETEIKPRDDSGVASAPPQQQQNNMQSEEGTTVTPKQKEKEVSKVETLKYLCLKRSVFNSASTATTLTVAFTL